MADKNTPPPEQETRGGDLVDWKATEPGKPLKQRNLADEVQTEPAPWESK